MASLTSSSRRSSSSYRSSARYSTSSSYRSEGSLGGSSDSLDPLFEPFLESADPSSLFGEEGPGGPNCLAPFSRHSRSSYGHTGEEADRSLRHVPISYCCYTCHKCIFNDKDGRFRNWKENFKIRLLYCSHMNLFYLLSILVHIFKQYVPLLTWQEKRLWGWRCARQM